MPEPEVVSRHVLVIMRRMDGLKDAIESRDWEAVEWFFDNVLGAVAKLHRALP